MLAATSGIAILSELLVDAIEATAESVGMNEVCAGAVLVAVIGNAAEHASATRMAARDEMGAAITIAVGSSTHMALSLAPVLVFLGHLVAPTRMDRRLTTLEVVAAGNPGVGHDARRAGLGVAPARTALAGCPPADSGRHRAHRGSRRSRARGMPDWPSGVAAGMLGRRALPATRTPACPVQVGSHLLSPDLP